MCQSDFLGERKKKLAGGFGMASKWFLRGSRYSSVNLDVHGKTNDWYSRPEISGLAKSATIKRINGV